MLRKIKLFFKRRKFNKLCLHIACPYCPNYFSGKCKIAVSLGLEEV